MLIKGINLRVDTVNEIGKFAILWNLFEHDWCNNACNHSKIKEIVPEIHVDDGIQRELARVLNERRSWFSQLEMDYVKESLHPGNARKSLDEEMDIMHNFLTGEGNDLLCGCFLVIYRIRNNMMHGLKIAEELDGQIDLFKAVNKVLENIRGII